MEFRNLTPFSVMEYAMDDKHNERHRVVAMKTGFRLVQDDNGQWQTQLMENPPMPLCIEDEFAGEMNCSPVLRESDLAPLKPACDVIVNGTAHTGWCRRSRDDRESPDAYAFRRSAAK
nr:DUF2169 domain-containing protein [Lelliottia nimipressuralis]